MEKKKHDLAHSIAEMLIKLTGTLANEHANGDAVVALYALEMAASATRRMCRDAGMDKDDVKKLQKAASGCGGELYRHILDSEDKQQVISYPMPGPDPGDLPN